MKTKARSSAQRNGSEPKGYPTTALPYGMERNVPAGTLYLPAEHRGNVFLRLPDGRYFMVGIGVLITVIEGKGRREPIFRWGDRRVTRLPNGAPSEYLLCKRSKYNGIMVQ